MFIKRSDYEKLVADRDQYKRDAICLLKISVSLWRQRKLIVEILKRENPEMAEMVESSTRETANFGAKAEKLAEMIQ